MTRTENGYAPRAGYFRAALDAIPDLRAPEMPEWEFYELSPLLDSSSWFRRASEKSEPFSGIGLNSP